jgi:anthranilate phosphoribosyltransferase
MSYIRKAIKQIVAGRDLTENMSRSVFGEIMSGRATPVQIGAFLTALCYKGETAGELAGAVKAVRSKALKVRAPGTVLDTCGTGGSGLNVFNVSTAVAFVAAGAGVRVAKHGNRSASSKCGSADVMEALGVNIDAPARVAERCLKKAGVCYMFAPRYHKAMKYAAPPRRELGFRTIFNLIGPLSNPANVKHQVLGVYDARLTGLVARSLRKLGTKRAYIVHGLDGLDEATITGKTMISELRGGRVRTYELSPADFGLEKASLRSLKGGDAEKNASMVRKVLNGGKGAKRDIVLMNSGLVLMAAGKARDPGEGVRIARDSIDSGAALDKLEMLVELTGKQRKA